MMNVDMNMKYPSDILQLLLELFSMFKIRIWYEMNNFRNKFPYSLRFNCIKCDKVVGYELDNQTIEDVITDFAQMWCSAFGLFCIIDSKE